MCRYLAAALLAVALAAASAVPLSAQRAVITTLDGDSVCVRSASLASDTAQVVSYLTLRGRQGEVARDQVFSIRDTAGAVAYLYRPLSDDDLDLAQMSSYIAGHKMVGRRYRKQRAGAFAVGFACGLVSMAYQPSTLYLAPVAPLGGCVMVSAFTLRSDRHRGDLDEYTFDGFRARRRRHNLVSSIWGGLSGMVVGSVGSFFVHGWGLK